MKKWWDAVKGAKGGWWMAVLAACAAAMLLLPAARAPASGMTEEEQRYSATLSRISGAGEVRLSIAYAQAASSLGGQRTPVGAVIVAQGAQNVAVGLNLTRAAEALLGLGPNAVEVFAMEEGP